MPRSVVSGLVAVLILAVTAFGVVQLTGDPAPQRSGSPPLTARGTAAERIDLKPGPADAVLTARGDLTRLGLDDQEPALSPAAVSSGRFGRRISYPVDGKIYAQPLYLPGLRIGGRMRDVVIVATEHDSVYAFDAAAAAGPGKSNSAAAGPGKSNTADRDDLHVMSIRDPEVRARLGLVWRTEDSVSPAARALISEARMMFPAPSDNLSRGERSELRVARLRRSEGPPGRVSP